MKTQSKVWMYSLVIGSLVIAKVEPQFNVLLCAAMAVYIVVRQRLDLIPLLILANIPISSFFFGGGAEYGTFEYSVEVYETAYINLFGLPISAGLVCVVAMAFVCYSNFAKAAQLYYPGVFKPMFIFWNVGALFAVLIALNGMLIGNQGWAGPLRAYLSTVGIFYGYALTIRSSHMRETLFVDFLILFLCLGVLAVLGVFHHRILFLGAGFVPALALIALSRQNLASKFLGLANLIVWISYTLIGFTFRGETTFTLMALFYVSFSLGLIITLRLQRLTKIVGQLLAYPTIFIIILYMSLAIFGFNKFSIGDYGRSGAELTLVEEVRFKIFDDRAGLWVTIWDDIMRDNKILPIPGEDLLVMHPKRGITYVRHGAHNSYLQALRENGFLSGTIIILLMFFTLKRSAKAYSLSVAGTTGALAIGSIATLTVGAVTGHYVIGQTIGVVIFMLGGMAMAGEDGHIYSNRAFGAMPGRL